MSSHHRVTQSLTEFYSFDFKLIKLCETPLDLHREILGLKYYLCSE